MRRMLGLLIVIVLLPSGYNLAQGTGSSRESRAPTQSAEPDVPAVPKPQSKLETVSLLETHRLSESPVLVWGQDPFIKRAGFSQADDEGALPALQAIISDRESSRVLINGKIYSKGSYVTDDYAIVDIGPNFVVLGDGTNLLELPLPSGKSSAAKAKAADGNLLDKLLKEIGR